MKLRPTLVAAFFAFLAGILPARAYFLEGQDWTKNRTVVMHLSLGGNTVLSDGFTSFNQSAADALTTWNDYLVHMKFAVDSPSLLPVADSDEDNSVAFASTVYGSSFGSGTLAVTLRSYRGVVMTEADVLFNNAYTWDSYRGPLRSGKYDFHRIALHEFGHVVGLDHPDQNSQIVTAIMNAHASNIDTLQTDDISGAQSIYNTGPAYLNANSAPLLVNLSTRGVVGTGDNALIGGFIVQGPQSITVVLRAIGHSLVAHGVTGALPDPTIEIHDSAGNIVAQNDDWIGSTDATTIASYHLDPPNSIESTVYVTLAPGSYTAVVRDYDASVTGTALVELYDLHLSNARVANISTRAQVNSGDGVLIGGFIVGAGATKTVAVRGLGPTLGDNNVANFLADPALELRDSSGNLVAANDNWGSGPNAAQIQSEGLAPKYAAESALQATLNPGSYTATLRGVNNGTGIGLVEVYDLSPAPQ